MSPTSLIPASSATPPPAWLVLRGRITRGQRLELERRLGPQQATSYTARYLLEVMGQWSAARATAELLSLGVCNVPNEVKRELRFSVGGTMATGLLPRCEYMAFKCLRRVVLPTCKDMQFAQPGEHYDYCLCQN